MGLPLAPVCVWLSPHTQQPTGRRLVLLLRRGGRRGRAGPDSILAVLPIGPGFQCETGSMRSSSRSSCSSWDTLYRSSASWPLSQNWGEVPSTLASRSAVGG